MLISQLEMMVRYLFMGSYRSSLSIQIDWSCKQGIFYGT
jgi:hypothetical protein